MVYLDPGYSDLLTFSYMYISEKNKPVNFLHTSPWV